MFRLVVGVTPYNGCCRICCLAIQSFSFNKSKRPSTRLPPSINKKRDTSKYVSAKLFVQTCLLKLVDANLFVGNHNLKLEPRLLFPRCVLVLLGAVLPGMEPSVVDDYLPRAWMGRDQSGGPSSRYAHVSAELYSIQDRAHLCICVHQYRRCFSRVQYFSHMQLFSAFFESIRGAETALTTPYGVYSFVLCCGFSVVLGV